MDRRAIFCDQHRDRGNRPRVRGLAEHMRKRSVIALLFGSATILAGGVAWLNREDILRSYVTDMLRDKRVQAAYRIENLGLSRQIFRDVRIGDPRNPDVIARRVEVELAYGLTGPRLAAVRADGVRLRGRFDGQKLSFGALDALIPQSDEAFELPDMDVALRDAQLALQTPWGAMGAAVAGSGNLQRNFSGRAGLVAAQLNYGDCQGRAINGDLRLTVADGTPMVSGPLAVSTLGCGAARVADLRLGIDAQIPVDLQRISYRMGVESGRLVQGTMQVARLSGEVIGTADGEFRTNARWRLTGYSGRAVGASLTSLSLAGDASRDASGNVAMRADARLSGARLAHNPLTDGQAALAATPIGPIVATLGSAVERMSRNGLGGQAALTLNIPQNGRAMLQAGNIALASSNGARLRVAAEDALRWDFVAAPRINARADFGGGGIPQGRLHFAGSTDRFDAQIALAPMEAAGARLALTPINLNRRAGQLRVATGINLSGPIGNGQVEGLRAAVNAVVGDDGSVRLAGGCQRVGWQSLTSGTTSLGASQFSLCVDGTNPLRWTGNGVGGAVSIPALNLSGQSGGEAVAVRSAMTRWDLGSGQFSMRDAALSLGDGPRSTQLNFASLDGRADGDGFVGQYAGAAGGLAAVPIHIDAAAGDWRWHDGALALGAQLRLTDVQSPPRFEPLASEDVQLRFADGRIRLGGNLFLPAQDGRQQVTIAHATVEHNVATGAGQADLNLVPLHFARDGLQPVHLTNMVLGVAADFVGTLTGVGHFRWSGDGNVTSDGEFATDSMDLAAIFGPVAGASGRIYFNDLLNLTTPPGQTLHIASVNPGIEVQDGVLLYQLLPGNRIQIISGRWPFAGGELRLRPTLLDFDAAAARFLTFDVEGVDAGIFLSRYQFDNINATGIFDGSLPTKFDADGGRVEGGELRARSGGTLAYLGELTNYDLGFFGNYAFRSLRALAYDNLIIRMNGRIDGEMLTEVEFGGLAQGEGAERNFITRALDHLPIHFTMRINAPFRQLLSSARAIYDPTILIEQNLPSLLREQQRQEAAPPAPADGQAVQPPLSQNGG